MLTENRFVFAVDTMAYVMERRALNMDPKVRPAKKRPTANRGVTRSFGGSRALPASVSTASFSAYGGRRMQNFDSTMKSIDITANMRRRKV